MRTVALQLFRNIQNGGNDIKIWPIEAPVPVHGMKRLLYSINPKGPVNQSPGKKQYENRNACKRRGQGNVQD
jgi:hypothetical protein